MIQNRPPNKTIRHAVGGGNDFAVSAKLNSTSTAKRVADPEARANAQEHLFGTQSCQFMIAQGNITPPRRTEGRNIRENRQQDGWCERVKGFVHGR
jgi:hypothetical protein